MRAIDADALRKSMFSYYDCVNEHTGKSNYRGDTLMDYEVADLIDNCIDNAPTIDPSTLRPKWISVEDRLPEIPEGWAECPSPVLYMMKSTKTIYAGYYGENGIYRDKYFRQYADAYEGVNATDVLCWMWQCDLPEPPDMRGDA